MSISFCYNIFSRVNNYLIFLFVWFYCHCFLSASFNKTFYMVEPDNPISLFPPYLHDFVSVWSDLLDFLWLYQLSWSLLSAYLSTWDILLVLLLPWAYSSHTSSVWPVCFLILLHSCCPLDFVLLLTTFTMVGIPFTSLLWDLLVLPGLLPHFSGAQHPVFHEEFMGSTI